MGRLAGLCTHRLPLAAVYEAAFAILYALLVWATRAWGPHAPYLLLAAWAAASVAVCQGARLVYPTGRSAAAWALAHLLLAFLALRLGYDALIHPQSTMAFTAGTGIVAAATAWAVFAKRGRIPKDLPFGLLAAWLLWSAFAGLFTWQADASLRTWLVWVGGGALFLAARLVAGHPPSRRLVCLALLAGAAFEAAYALIHLEYILPVTQATVQAHPELMAGHASSGAMAQGIAERLSARRAFGSFVSPNALAALMAPCLLLAAGVAVQGAVGLRAKRVPRSAPLPFALVSASGLAVGLFCLLQWYASVLQPLVPGEGWGLAGRIFAAVLVGLTAGVLVYAASQRWGAGPVASALTGSLGLGATALCGWTLVQTWSRGGLLGCAAGVLVFLALLIGMKRRRLCTAAVLLAAACAMGTGQAGQPGRPDSRTPSLKRPETAMLRLGYWRVGVEMAAHHPAAGVGPGNFAIGYTKYKTPASGPTKEAHNDYLEITCETGLVGGLLFIAFWSAVILQGIRSLRISLRFIGVGLLAALTAFVAHALVEFNFSHPGLLAFAFILAGLVLPTGRGKGERLWGVVPVLVAWVLVGASLPPWQTDRALGSASAAQRRVAAARAFAGASDGAALPWYLASAWFVDQDELGSWGTIEKQSARAGEFLRVAHNAEAQDALAKRIKDRIRLLEDADRAYPWSPELARRIAHWQEALMALDAEGAAGWHAEQALAWYGRAIARSPHEAGLRLAYALLRWRTAGADARAYEEALDQFHQAAHLHPAAAPLWQTYADHAAEFARSLRTAGNAGAAEPYARAAQQARQRAAQLDNR